jgi:hypothetical protein
MTYEQYKKNGITILNYTVHQHEEFGPVIVALCSGKQFFKIDAPITMLAEITEKVSRLRKSIYYEERTTKADRVENLAKRLKTAIKKANILNDEDYAYGKHCKELALQ